MSRYCGIVIVQLVVYQFYTKSYQWSLAITASHCNMAEADRVPRTMNIIRYTPTCSSDSDAFHYVIQHGDDAGVEGHYSAN